MTRPETCGTDGGAISMWLKIGMHHIEYSTETQCIIYEMTCNLIIFNVLNMIFNYSYSWHCKIGSSGGYTKIITTKQNRGIQDTGFLVDHSFSNIT